MSEAVSRALLLTDVVDSTRLAESLGDARMAEVWRAHDRVARDLLERHVGREVDRTDGFLLLFERASDAAAYALAYHGALKELSASQGVELEARVGLHVGEVVLRENPEADVRRGAKPLEVEGVAKPLAARVMALGRGGQTLLTPSAVAELGVALPEGAQLESHGHYQLKGLVEPVELAELGVKGEAPFAPPEDGAKAYRVVRQAELWRPVREVPHALPAERDAFVGRQAELLELSRRLDSGARLVTVLGPGGTGKTRLARRYGWTWLGDWPGGVWFADLSESRAVDGMAHAVASALGVALGKEDPVVQLGHAIAGRGRCLVVLDNFEQVVEHAEATLGRWLERAQEAAFVVTSRERLHIRGEDVMALEPLEPEGEGVELFELRARSHKQDFALTPENLSQVQEVVRLLDGLPLAIELAAARVRVLSPGQILERMKDRFKLLTGARSAAARQATLKAAIDWSWGLLEPWEQAVLAQASVFAGGFTLEAAQAVLTLEGFPEAPWAIDVVQSLVDKSLLRTWTVVSSAQRLGIEEPYFGMYLSIEEYAREKLRTEGAIAGASGAEAERSALERHGAYYARLGSEEALEALDRHGGVAKRHALAEELENLMAALSRALAREDADTATACYLAAWAVLALEGPFATGVELGRAVLAREGLEPSTRGRVGGSLGGALHASGRMDEARAHLEAALAIHREVGNRGTEAVVLSNLGTLHRQQGRIQEAQESHEAALAIARELGSRSSEGGILGSLGIVHWQQGRMDEAWEHYEAALGIARELGNRRSEGGILCNLGVLHRDQGRMEEAQEHYEKALAIDREVGNRNFEGRVLGNLGSLHRQLGRMDEAREHYEAALAIDRELGNRSDEGYVLGNLGVLHVDQGRLEEAREHYEAALAIHREVGNRSGEGKLLTNLGELHRELGRLEEAREHYEAALAIHRELGNRSDEGGVLGNLGSLHGVQGRLEEARAHLEAALAIHRELGNRQGESVLIGNLGILHSEQGRLEEAREHYEAALAIHREVGDRRREGGVLTSLGNLHIGQGRTEEAREHFEAALAIARELGSRRGEGTVLGNLGKLELALGRREEAESAYARGEGLLREVGNPITLGNLLCGRGELERVCGRLGAARACLEEATSLATEAKSGPDSQLGRAVAELREALGDA